MSLDPSTTEDRKSPPEGIPIPEIKGRLLSMEGFPASGLAAPPVAPRRIRLVGANFKGISRTVEFDVGQLDLKLNEKIVAEVPDKGILLGQVMRGPYEIDNSILRLRLPTTLRKAGASDLENHERIKKMEIEALMRVQAAVSRHNLTMDVFQVSYTLDMKKAFVYFLSPDRVDFRNLLRDLVHDLKAKIELRQVGERDDARMKGGLGPCGEELCCSRYINRFQPVNVKMAKDQDLSLKPTRVTGACGRLKCCLAYEEDVYLDARKRVPAKGKCVTCKSGGCGTVRDVNFLTEKVLVQLEDGAVQMYPASEVTEDRSRKSQYENTDRTHGNNSNDESDKLDDAN